MAQLKFEIGNKVVFDGEEAIIIKIFDLDRITIQILRSNLVYTVRPNELSILDEETKSINKPFDLLTDKEWEEANRRFKIIKPIIDSNTTKTVKEISRDNNIHFSTIYRWLKLYSQEKVISSLVSKRNGGKNKSRLDKSIDVIIDDAIKTIYLSSSKKSISKVIRSILVKCKEQNLKPPHSNTIRNRIKKLSEEEVLRARYGYKKARDKFEPIRGNFPGANYPLSIVQIDHTCLDIILVDEHFRKPFRRPYLTLAMDVYSRMVTGFYLSFDPPGALGTGLCIANSILSKELWLEKHNVTGEWPCWGTMNTIHVDNAKEFRGNMLKKACVNYNINLEFRPIATPHWGGHVERLLGTFSKEIHNLSGTTFSDIKNRENYDSTSNASLTIKELEKWLLVYIVNVYHKKNHSSIGMSPIEKYKEGIFGVNGSGIPPKLMDHRKIRLDFMPFQERTIQEYGVVIDHIYYYSEVLRRYIHKKEDFSKYSRKQKFIFKRDPRDISIIYFYDPELDEYFDIPYRDTSKPPISIWEYNEVINHLKRNNSSITEDSIFEAYKEMEEIELKAIRETKKLKQFSRYSDKRNIGIHIDLKKPNNESFVVNKESIVDIKPFEDIDDEAFT